MKNIIKKRTIFQLFKYGVVGLLNICIDLGVLNFLMWSFGITAGLFYSVFKGISFMAANSNSYYWNKLWTFEKRDGGIFKEVFKFFAIGTFGLLINIIVASVIVNVIGPQFEISPKIWANIGAIVAAFIAGIWNFSGYKFLVFKK